MARPCTARAARQHLVQSGAGQAVHGLAIEIELQVTAERENPEQAVKLLRELPGDIPAMR